MKLNYFNQKMIIIYKLKKYIKKKIKDFFQNNYYYFYNFFCDLMH